MQSHPLRFLHARFLLAAALLSVFVGAPAVGAAEIVKVRPMDYFYPAREHAVWNYLVSKKGGGYDAEVVRFNGTSYKLPFFQIKDGLLVEKRKSVMRMYTVAGKFVGDKIVASSIQYEENFYGKGPGYALYGFDDLKGKNYIRFSPGAEFPETMVVGKEITAKTDMFDWQGRHGPDATVIAEVVEKTAVTVPAGTFPDCIHMRFTVSLKGGPAPQVADEWWARGIGMVRSKVPGEKGTSSITKLHSYAIPYEVTIDFWNGNGKFGSRAERDFPIQKYVRVKNNGTKSIRGVKLSMTGSNVFTYEQLTKGKVTPGGTAEIVVTFHPTGIKSYKAILKAEEIGNPDNACTLPLYGTGTW